MLNITSENLHIYIFAIIGFIVICFAVELYIKNSLETEMANLKKKVKKLQATQDALIEQKQAEEEYRRRQQEMAETEEEMHNDSYMDPLE
jgi:hypothetical protein